jgi:hypothetical protein
MPNENFRRELGHVFDEMTGSPTAALPDRVRSSLGSIPEQRAPFWIAGVAAGVIAAMVVGILVVASFNRNPTGIAPAGAPSPSPSASPAASPTASPTPESNLPAFQCTDSLMHLDYAKSPSQALIDALRTGTHSGYDRVTVEWNGSPAPAGPTSIEVMVQSGTSFTRSPSGQAMTLAGKNGILVIIRNADLHTGYSGPTDIKTGYATLVEVRQVEDFEGVVQLGLGVSGAACYRAFLLATPDRLVIDIKSAT